MAHKQQTQSTRKAERPGKQKGGTAEVVKPKRRSVPGQPKRKVDEELTAVVSAEKQFMKRKPVKVGRGGLKHRELAMAMLEGEGKLLMRKMIDRALGGCPVCIRLCMERLLPAKREGPTRFTIPPIKQLCDVPPAIRSVLGQVTSGALTLSEGRSAIQLLQAWAESMALSAAANSGGKDTAQALAQAIKEAASAMDAVLGISVSG